MGQSSMKTSKYQQQQIIHVLKTIQDGELETEKFLLFVN